VSEDSGFERGLTATGMVIGGIASVITFIAVYIAAVGSVGWVIGIALGWIPAGLASALAYVVFRYLWWLMLLGIGWLLLYA
jgi:hypothetical protein